MTTLNQKIYMESINLKLKDILKKKIFLKKLLFLECLILQDMIQN